MSKQLIEGRGVTRGTIYWVPPEMLTIIGVDTKDGPEHRLWDERINLPLDQGMVDSIVSLGVKETITVEVDDDDRLLVVDGRRRVRAGRAANKALVERGDPVKAVPVMASRASEAVEKISELLGAALNEHRLNDTTMTKAAKAVRMLARGHARADVALAMNVDVQTIGSYEQIVSLCAKVRQAIDAGSISPSAAAKLSDLTKTDQEAALEKLMAEGGKLTVKRAAAASRSRKNGSDDAVVAPSKRVIRRVIEGGRDTLPDDFIQALRWAVGDIGPKSIKGLSAIASGEAESAEAAE